MLFLPKTKGSCAHVLLITACVSDYVHVEGSAIHNPDLRFKRFCQIFIKIRDSSQDLKYFKSLEYHEILSLLAVNTEMLQRFKILPVSYKI